MAVSVIYLLPDEPCDITGSLTRLIRTDECFCIENCTRYWDESHYKKLRGSIKGDDRMSVGLRRLSVQNFTDIRYIEALPDEYGVAQADGEDTSEFSKRYAALSVRREKCAVANLFGARHPTGISVWRTSGGSEYIQVQPILYSKIEINDWFAENREPVRRYNHTTDPKHKNKERMADGLVVSAMALSEDEIERALSHAVGCPGERRLLYYDRDKEMVVVFSLENHPRQDESCIYHGHQLQATDRVEISRLPQGLIRNLEYLNDIKLR